MSAISNFGVKSEIRKYEASRSYFQKERERGITDLLNHEDKSYQSRFGPTEITDSINRDVKKVQEKRQEYAEEISKSMAYIIAFVIFAIAMTVLAFFVYPGMVRMTVFCAVAIAIVEICYHIFVIKSVERYRNYISLWYYYLGEDEGIKSEIMDWEPSTALPEI